jgi:23S rRNA pseudouridine1911/1915/1917 synthase
LSPPAASWTADADSAGARLDRFLAERMPDRSRSQIQGWIRRGCATVDGAAVKTGHRLRTGERVELEIPLPPVSGPFAEAIPLDILFEDADLVVLNKPAGLVCHAGAGVRSGTLVNALLHHLGSLEAGDPERPGIVHRLDKLTSGVMLAAKNPRAHRLLSDQFKNRRVRKCYVALVHGSPRPGRATIDSAIGRDPRNRKRISSRARHKRPAVTHYEVREDFGFAALLDVRIETGRTHQIRVHLAESGHPVVGDAVYGRNRTANLPPAIVPAAAGLGRPFLHSGQLEFTHPRSGAPLSFQAPLPAELERFLALVRAAGRPGGPGSESA